MTVLAKVAVTAAVGASSLGGFGVARAQQQSAADAGPTVIRSEARLTSKLPVYLRNDSPTKKRVASQLTVTLAAGETIRVTAALQATNPYAYNVMYCTFLVVTRNGEGPTWQGQFLRRPMGTNITRAQHHYVLTTAGAYTAPEAGTYVLSQVAYAASNRATTGAALVLDHSDVTISR